MSVVKHLYLAGLVAVALSAAIAECVVADRSRRKRPMKALIRS